MLYNHSSRADNATEKTKTTHLFKVESELSLTWLNNLPLTDINRSVKLVIEKLGELRQSSTALRKKFETMELVRPTINFLAESLQINFLEDATLPRAKKRKVKERAQALEMTAVALYSELLKSDEEYLDQAIQATCIHRAIVHITKMMMHSYQTYSPIQPKLWTTLYQLYHEAEEKELTDHIVYDATYPDVTNSSIKTVFNIPLLLATANPYQLQVDDIRYLFQNLALWAVHVKLHAQAKEDDLYVIALEQDQAPLYQRFLKPDHDASMVRGLDFTRTCNHLHMLLETIEPRTEESPSIKTPEKYKYNLSSSVIQHLIRVWQTFPDRSFPRTDNMGDIKVSLGLASPHHFLNNQQPIMPDLKTGDRKSAASVTKRNYHQHDWQLVNSSANGYCLCTATDYLEAIEVGSIVGIQEQSEENKQYWHIGTIRWVKFTEEDECQIGIQLIAPNAIAVGIQTQQQRAYQRHFLGGLLLPELKAFAQPPTLVTPNIAYQVGNIVHIVNDTIDSDIKLNACIEQTKKFKQFTFDIIKQFAEVIPFEP